MQRTDAMANRRRLILAARDAVAADGPGVSIREIADRAEVGITTLYRHFRDKQALIDALSIYRWSTMTELVHRTPPGEGSLTDVVAIVDSFTRMVTADRDFIAALSLDVGRTPAGIKPVKEQFDHQFARIWAAAQRGGELRRHADPRDVMELAGLIRNDDRRAPMVLTLLSGISAASVDVRRCYAWWLAGPIGSPVCIR